MVSLTEFQNRCEVALKEALIAEGKAPFDQKIEGDNEPYIAGIVGDVHVYIYLDEAELVGKKSYSFERADYTNDEELISAFVKAVLSVAAGAAPEEKGSKRKIFFRGKPI